MEENNKLIAEFMGFTKGLVYNEKGKQYDYTLPNGFELIKEVETTIESNWCEVLEEQDYCFIEDLKFNTSWDWLMPVVEKIESLGYSYDRINADVFINTQEGENVIPNPMDRNIMTMLQKTYKAVVEFIKWYNKQ